MIVLPSATAIRKPVATKKEVPIKDKSLACSKRAFIIDTELQSDHTPCKSVANLCRADCMLCSKPEHC